MAVASATNGNTTTYSEPMSKGGNQKVDEETRAKLEYLGIMQGPDNNFYENGKLLTNPKTNHPMTEEEVKAYAESKKKGTFPETAAAPASATDGMKDTGGPGEGTAPPPAPAAEGAPQALPDTGANHKK